MRTSFDKQDILFHCPKPLPSLTCGLVSISGPLDFGGESPPSTSCLVSISLPKPLFHYPEITTPSTLFFFHFLHFPTDHIELFYPKH